MNTAAIFPSSPDGQIDDAQWGLTLDVNVTANHRLMEEAAKILKEQDLTASVVLVSSANAVVPKHGSEAYDVSKAAVNHLVREFAIALAPKVRVNGISPATVVKGSTMFPRDRIRFLLIRELRTNSSGPPSRSSTRSALSLSNLLIPRIAQRLSCFLPDRRRVAPRVI